MYSILLDLRNYTASLKKVRRSYISFGGRGYDFVFLTYLIKHFKIL